MKKQYICPAIEVVETVVAQPLLNASNVYNMTGNGTQLGREFNIFDDDVMSWNE